LQSLQRKRLALRGPGRECAAGQGGHAGYDAMRGAGAFMISSGVSLAQISALVGCCASNERMRVVVEPRHAADVVELDERLTVE
jgi:hypothetical protein